MPIIYCGRDDCTYCSDEECQRTVVRVGYMGDCLCFDDGEEEEEEE